ncbi:hypothetical protein J3R73_002436 [Labrys monachus]|uniref:Uncharacterized protein n=1 Tax=Labrys monachus TaxID=217067 RepID=A0ABU0FDH5_9HYPH|nr:hypothetical protein [Labrys monachus]
MTIATEQLISILSMGFTHDESAAYLGMGISP